jgi:GMP synthase-like glutamine amidotransferase
MRPVLIRQHGPSAPPAILADWLRDRGLPAVIHPAHLGVAPPDPADFLFVASLGSANTPAEPNEAVRQELDLLARAIDRDVPVLGLCFGGQALAVALGGRVERSDMPEVGWYEVQTDDPEQIPPGPWLQWHYDRFHVPPGATEIARTDVASQAFRQGPHLGVQFHPESTADIVIGWASREDSRARVAEYGISDGPGRVEAGRANESAAADAAYQLFDAFWERAREERSP